MKAPCSSAGFSLIEVMVAILILGVGLAALAHGITTALASSKESEMQTTAALYAAGKVEELRATGELDDGESDGDCGPGLKSYRWKETVSPADINGLHEVDVVIEEAQDGSQIYELKTALFEISDNATGSQSNSKSKSRNKNGNHSQ